MSNIRHEPDHQRFSDGDAQLTYRLPAAGLIDLVSVQVPPERRGEGLAGALTRAAFAHAAEQGLTVRPTCSYISGAFLKRHPEFREQVESQAPGTSQP